MLWIFLIVGGCGGIIMLLCTLFEIVDCYRDWPENSIFVKKLAIFIVIGTVGLFGIEGINCLSYTETSQTSNYELVSLTDYSFYYKNGDDISIKSEKIEAGNTIIYEKDNCTPHIVEYTTYTKNKMNNVLRAILAFGYGESSEKSYEIYTPKATIPRDFSLDNQ